MSLKSFRDNLYVPFERLAIITLLKILLDAPSSRKNPQFFIVGVQNKLEADPLSKSPKTQHLSTSKLSGSKFALN